MHRRAFILVSAWESKRHATPIFPISHTRAIRFLSSRRHGLSAGASGAGEERPRPSEEDAAQVSPLFQRGSYAAKRAVIRAVVSHPSDTDEREVEKAAEDGVELGSARYMSSVTELSSSKQRQERLPSTRSSDLRRQSKTGKGVSESSVQLSSGLPHPPTFGRGEPRITTEDLCSYLLTLQRVHKMSSGHPITQRATGEAALRYLRDILPNQVRKESSSTAECTSTDTVPWTASLAISVIRTTSTFGFPLSTLPVVEEASKGLLDMRTRSAPLSWPSIGTPLELAQLTLLINRLLAREHRNRGVARKVFCCSDAAAPNGSAGSASNRSATAVPSSQCLPSWHESTDDEASVSKERPLLLFYNPESAPGYAEECLHKLYIEVLLPQMVEQLRDICAASVESAEERRDSAHSEDVGDASQGYNREGLELFSSTLSVLHKAVNEHLLTPLQEGDQIAFHQGKHTSKPLKKVPFPLLVCGMQRCVRGVEKVFSTSLRRRENPNPVSRDVPPSDATSLSPTSSRKSRFTNRKVLENEDPKPLLSSSEAPTAVPQITGVQNVNHDIIYPVLQFGFQPNALDLLSHREESDEDGNANLLNPLWRTLGEELLLLLKWSCVCVPVMRTRHLAALGTTYRRLILPSVVGLRPPQTSTSAITGTKSSAASSRFALALSRYTITEVLKGTSHPLPDIFRSSLNASPEFVLGLLCKRALEINSYFSSSDTTAFLKALSTTLLHFRQTFHNSSPPDHIVESYSASLRRERVESLVWTTVMRILPNLDAQGYSPARCPGLVFALDRERGSFEVVSKRIPRYVAKASGHISLTSQRVLTVQECSSIHSSLSSIFPILPEVWMNLIGQMLFDFNFRDQENFHVRHVLGALMESPSFAMNFGVREGTLLTLERASEHYAFLFRIPSGPASESSTPPVISNNQPLCPSEPLLPCTHFLNLLGDAYQRSLGVVPLQLFDECRGMVDSALKNHRYFLHAHSTEECCREIKSVVDLFVQNTRSTSQSKYRNILHEIERVARASMTFLAVVAARCHSESKAGETAVTALLYALETPYSRSILVSLCLLSRWTVLHHRLHGVAHLTVGSPAAAALEQLTSSAVILASLLEVSLLHNSSLSEEADPHRLLVLGNVFHQISELEMQQSDIRQEAKSEKLHKHENDTTGDPHQRLTYFILNRSALDVIRRGITALACQARVSQFMEEGKQSAGISFMRRISQFYAVPVSLRMHTSTMQQRIQRLFTVPSWLLKELFVGTDSVKIWLEQLLPLNMQWMVLAVFSQVWNPVSTNCRVTHTEFTENFDLSSVEPLITGVKAFCGIPPIYTSVQQMDGSIPLSLSALTALVKQWTVALVVCPPSRKTDSGVLKAFLHCLTAQSIDREYDVFKAFRCTLGNAYDLEETLPLFFGAMLEALAVARQELVGERTADMDFSRQLLELEDVIAQCFTLFEQWEVESECSWWSGSAAFSSNALRSITYLVMGLIHLPAKGLQTIEDEDAYQRCSSSVFLRGIVRPFLEGIARVVNARRQVQQSDTVSASTGGMYILVDVPPVELLQGLAELDPSLLHVVLNFQVGSFERRRIGPRQPSSLTSLDATQHWTSSGNLTPLDCLLQVLLTLEAPEMPLGDEVPPPPTAVRERDDPSVSTAEALLGGGVRRIGPAIAKAIQRQEKKSGDQHAAAGSATAVNARRQRGRLISSLCRLLSQSQNLTVATPMTVGRLSLVLDSPHILGENRILGSRIAQLLFHCVLKNGTGVACSTLTVLPSPLVDSSTPSSFQQIVYYSPVGVLPLRMHNARTQKVLTLPPSTELMIPYISLSTWCALLSGPRPLSLFWAASQRKMWMSRKRKSIRDPNPTASRRNPSVQMDGAAIRNIKFHRSGFLFLMFFTDNQLKELRTVLGSVSFLHLCREVLWYYTEHWIGLERGEAVLHDELRMAEKQQLWSIMKEWETGGAEASATRAKKTGPSDLPPPKWTIHHKNSANEHQRREKTTPSLSNAGTTEAPLRGLRLWYTAAHDMLVSIVDGADDAHHLKSIVLEWSNSELDAREALQKRRASLLQHRVGYTAEEPGSIGSVGVKGNDSPQRGISSNVTLDIGILVDLVKLLETLYYDGVELSCSSVLHLQLEELGRSTLSQMVENTGSTDASLPPRSSCTTRFLLSLFQLAIAVPAVCPNVVPVNLIRVLSYWPPDRQLRMMEEVTGSLCDKVMYQRRQVEDAVMSRVWCPTDRPNASCFTHEHSNLYEIALRATLDLFPISDVVAVFNLMVRRITDGDYDFRNSTWTAVDLENRSAEVVVDSLCTLLPSMSSHDVLQSTRAAHFLYAWRLTSNKKKDSSSSLSVMEEGETSCHGTSTVLRELRRFLSAVPVLCANDVERFQLSELIEIFTLLFFPPGSVTEQKLSMKTLQQHSLVSAQTARSLADHLVIYHGLEDSLLYNQLENYRTAVQAAILDSTTSSFSIRERTPLKDKEEGVMDVMKEVLYRLLPSFHEASDRIHEWMKWSTSLSNTSRPFVHSFKTLRGDDTRSQLIYFLRLLAIMEGILKEK